MYNSPGTQFHSCHLLIYRLSLGKAGVGPTLLGKRKGRNRVGRIREIQFRWEDEYSWAKLAPSKGIDSCKPATNAAKLVKARELAGRGRKEMQAGNKCNKCQSNGYKTWMCPNQAGSKCKQLTNAKAIDTNDRCAKINQTSRIHNSY